MNRDEIYRSPEMVRELIAIALTLSAMPKTERPELPPMVAAAVEWLDKQHSK